MADETPVAIEVALNGATSLEKNPHVPRTQEELIADAIRCIEAGASIVHTHAPDISLGGVAGALQYVAHFAPVHERFPDAVLYPTLCLAASVEEKTSHIEPLAERFALRMGFVDPGSLNLAPTDDEGVPLPADFVYANSHAQIAYKFALCERLKLAPGMAIFEPGFLRTALAWHRAGRMPRGGFLRFYLGGTSSYRGEGPTDLLFGLPPVPASIDTYLSMLDGADLPWSVAVVSGDTLENGVGRRALECGGHLRVGLEDYAGPRQPSNLELVEEAVALCQQVGRPVARPDEIGKLLNLPR